MNVYKVNVSTGPNIHLSYEVGVRGVQEISVDIPHKYIKITEEYGHKEFISGFPFFAFTNKPKEESPS